MLNYEAEKILQLKDNFFGKCYAKPLSANYS